MKKSFKYIAMGLVVLAVGLGLWRVKQIAPKLENATVIATSFPSFDLARAILGKNTSLKARMLLKPGSESHSFEPTPQDIIDIKNSRLFIYNGGESDEWVEEILAEIDPQKTKVVRLVDLVKTKPEELIEGMDRVDENAILYEYDKEQENLSHQHENQEHVDHDHEEDVEIDEHVWTSPANATEIIKKLEKILTKISPADTEKFAQNSQKYLQRLDQLDTKFRQLVQAAKRRTIVVADRFPFRYFADAYGLKYYAAFPGCSEQTEASAKTLAFLINKVKSEQLPAVFKIELSSGKIAENIARETGAQVLELNSGHNITAQDFAKGKTLVDIMQDNLITLQKALN